MKRLVMSAQGEGGYELLDCGDEQKLERFGAVVVARPDPQALWPRSLTPKHWASAEASFVRSKGGESGLARSGSWRIAKEVPEEWLVEVSGLSLWVRPTAFKHMGLFPEQTPNWQWASEHITKSISRGADKPKILNLFGYTGGATLAAAVAGAEVTHVDSSKTAVAWARKNAEVSGLTDAPIRWIVDDVRAFVAREYSRGVRYDAIIMDPPAFGHGVKRELWKIENDLLSLIEGCKKILSEKPLFFLINGYAAGYSPLAFAYNIESLERDFGGVLECGELTIQQTPRENVLERLLPCGIFARWHNAI